MESILFPELLAGPIIRRVDSSKAYIWIATSRKFKIRADCYAITTRYEGNEYDKIHTTSKTQTISLGENLHIHLIKIAPRRPFKTNQLIGYNIRFKGKSESFDLDDLGLLNPVSPNSIVYGSLKYPTFYIPEKDTNRTDNFLFGSCRKPHGDGDDTLSLGDQLVEEHCRNLPERPQALFLMGDQIYADDVPDSLFRKILVLSRELIGRREKLTSIESRLSEEPYQSSLDKINGRKPIIQKLAQFTSEKSFNHLIGFGEYAAMYLFAWSPVLWEVCDQRELNETFDEAVEKGHIYIRSKSEKLRLHEKIQLKKRYTDQEKQVVNYRKSTYKIRRLMANIPTYMIFDDHDVTDDWNINAEWKEKVSTSPLGKHIVANGLAAFWAFQGWGNEPTLFKREFIYLMAKYFRELQNRGKNIYYKVWVKTLWEHRPWYFVAPTTPTAVFLDTRTMRDYNQPKTKKQEQPVVQINPPQLVNELELKGLSYLLKRAGWKRKRPLLIISPTPIVGFEIIEEIVTKFSVPLKMLGLEVETAFDMEAWRYNGKGLTKLLNQVAKWNPNECIILSGDVHYSFLVYSNITFSSGIQMKLKQITSSPLKNMSFHKLGQLVKSAAALNQVLQDDETINRFADKSYHIHSVDKNNPLKKDFLWKDELTYHFVDGYSIIETENNLGYLSISPNKIETKLIKESVEE
ncbi:alkaline phosphatase D family protein [Ureibacillus acetophenoni]|uniref:PhoD-like phosphatase n=1 Tax=Ureibacillus acetophenoni TaxID=614649 RepID=A0A285UES4_9BACL|nr:alkaline phosphatase D family protein [Ureibacillus acetophenoni]SOC39878.1 PhoD-like phosphatase [Ureibacillus acetophenoni]